MPKGEVKVERGRAKLPESPDAPLLMPRGLPPAPLALSPGEAPSPPSLGPSPINTVADSIRNAAPATGNQGGQIPITMARGITHTGTHQHDRVIEQRLPVRCLFGFQLFQESGETMHMRCFDCNKVSNHVRIIPVMR